MEEDPDSNNKHLKRKKSNNKEVFKFRGPVFNLEEHVQSNWWQEVFNSIYLKTDADVVDDPKITKKEIDLFLSILKLSPEDRILDLCCGHGRHVLEIARDGFLNIEGLDRSHYLIQRAKTQAKKEGLGVKFREGDARKLPYSPDTFEGVMILGNSFGYFETIQDDIRILKEVYKALKPWGQILIDVSDGEYLRKNFKPRSWEWIDKRNFVCRERSLSLDKQRLISREVVVHEKKGVIVDQFYAERLYTKESLFELLKAAGFSDISFQGDLSPDSRRNQDLGMMEKRIIVTARVRKDWATVRVKDKKSLKDVAVVLGDPSKNDFLKPSGVFDDDDFYTIDKMKSALRELGHEEGYRFKFLNNHDTLIQDLIKLKKKKRLDLIFNLCDEGYLNDARKELHVPALLEMLGVPYTGAGPQCLAFCYDKSLVRGIANEIGVSVPDAFFIKSEDITFKLPFDFPIIAKPNFGDSSFGITQRSVAHNIGELMNAISEIRKKLGYDKPILIEEFLSGKDLSVGIVGNPPENYKVLPIIEEDYSTLPKEFPRICGYEAKWLPNSPYQNLHSIPAKLSEDTEKFIVKCCLELFGRLECRDYCRFDWRLNAKGQPKLLEVNPNPGWCWDGHLAKMAKFSKISYSEVLRMILKATEQRLKLKNKNFK